MFYFGGLCGCSANVYEKYRNTELDMRVFSFHEKIIIISGTSPISRLGGTGITTCGI